MARVVQQPLQRHQTLPKSEPNPETQAGSIRPAQHPGIFALGRVRPKRRLSTIQNDIGYPKNHFRPLAPANLMNRSQGCPQFRFVDPLLYWPPLKAGLCFHYAILDGFDPARADEGAP